MKTLKTLFVFLLFSCVVMAQEDVVVNYETKQYDGSEISERSVRDGLNAVAHGLSMVQMYVSDDSIRGGDTIVAVSPASNEVALVEQVRVYWDYVDSAYVSAGTDSINLFGTFDGAELEIAHIADTILTETEDRAYVIPIEEEISTDAGTDIYLVVPGQYTTGNSRMRVDVMYRKEKW